VYQFYPWATSQVTVTGTATQILALNNSRSGVSIENLGSTDVYLGENANVTTSTGYLLNGSKGASVSFSTTGAIYGITGGGSATVCVLVTQ